MVDTTDLKSVDLIGREGSSPSTPIFEKCVTISYNLLQTFLISLVIIYIQEFIFKN